MLQASKAEAETYSSDAGREIDLSEEEENAAKSMRRSSEPASNVIVFTNPFEAKLYRHTTAISLGQHPCDDRPM
jgi:hypothetical protein